MTYMWPLYIFSSKWLQWLMAGRALTVKDLYLYHHKYWSFTEVMICSDFTLFFLKKFGFIKAKNERVGLTRACDTHTHTSLWER